MIPNDLHFLFPEGAYVGLIIFILLASVWSLYLFRKEFIGLFSSSAQSQIFIERNTLIFWLKAAMLCVAWLGAVIAIMQPEGNGHYPLSKEQKQPPASASKGSEGVLQRKAHDVIFLMDASASMEVTDMRGGKSRFDYSKELADVIISQLKGENIALHAFTSGVSKLSPLTMDYLFVRLMLRQMQINEGDMAGTNIMEALDVIKNEYLSTITPKSKTLIIMTDGGDTRLESLKGDARQNEIDKALSFLSQSEELQLNVITIGLGTKQGQTVPNILYQGQPVQSALDENLLKQISERGRGRSYIANDHGIEELASTIADSITNQPVGIEEYKIKQRHNVMGKDDLIYDRLFQVPLGFAILLLSFILLFPNTFKRIA